MLFLVSGKRAVGKDTFCNIFINHIRDGNKNKNKVIALADAPKKAFCIKYELDHNKFMNDRSFKEQYRKQFINFAENAKKYDKYFWCKEAIKNTEHLDNIIISDLRYPVELEFFMKYFSRKLVTIRIDANDDTRKTRGWIFNKLIDEHVSENGLDDIEFDYSINNNTNDNGTNIKQQLRKIL